MNAGLASRHLIEVGHSMNMVAELPRYTHDSSVPLALQAAALDAFFVHLRLLIEFLISKPPNNKPPAISRWDYAKDFQINNTLREGLTKAADFASVHVAHFNASRAPVACTPAGLTPSTAELITYREDVFTAMGALAQYLAEKGSEHAAYFGGLLKEAQQLAQA